MVYEKQEWSSGDYINAYKLNHIEEGIYEVAEAIDQNATDIENKADKTSLTDGSVTKVGTATVGSGTKPMYLNSGTPTASSSTVGSGTKPMYLSSGTMTESSSTVGSSSTPVYLNGGTLTACGYSLSDLNSALANKADSSTVSSLSSTVTTLQTTVNSESPRIYRVNLGSSNDYIAANLCFAIGNMGNWPALIYFQNRIGILTVTGTSVGSSLAASPVDVTWLNGSAPASISTIQAATHSGATNGVRIKITATAANSNADLGILPMRSTTCYSYYASTS